MTAVPAAGTVTVAADSASLPIAAAAGDAPSVAGPEWSAQLGPDLRHALVGELASLPGAGSLGFAAADAAGTSAIGVALFGQYAAIGLAPISGALAATPTLHDGPGMQPHPQLVAPPSHLTGTS